MANSNQPERLILFEEFIEFLRYNGFSVGVDTHLKVNQLLESLDENYPAEQLKTLLAPIFSHSPQQQQEFYRLFESYFSRYLHPNEEPQTQAIPSTPPHSPKPEPGILPYLAKRRYYIFIQTLLLIGLGYLGVQAIDCYLQTRTLNGTFRCLSGLPPVNAPIVNNEEPVDSATPDNEEFPSSTVQLSREDSIFQRLSEQLPLSEGNKIEEDISDLKADWYQQYGPVLKALFIVLIITAFVFYELYWYNRRKLFLIREQNKHPPYFWQLSAEKSNRKLYTEQEFFLASRKLREREPTETEELDLEDTIQQTIDAGGYPSLSYQSRTRPPEYLVLIEKRSNKDHLAMLFDQLVLELSEQDLYLERYFYEHDPRVCWQERHADEIYLEDLHKKYPDNRLIIIGNTDPLFDPVTDNLCDWVNLLFQWKNLALLTPKSTLNWGHRELTLSRKMVFLPSTLEAVSSIVEIFNQDKQPPVSFWLEQNIYPPPPDVEDGISIEEVYEYLHMKYKGIEEDGNDPMGDYLFDWLCTCAVYPEISWDMTLLMGERFGNKELNQFPTPQNLFKLSQIPWFREGQIPEEMRAYLINKLDKEKLKTARLTILEMLKSNPPPKGSYAEVEYKLNIAVQEAQLKTTLGKNLKAIQMAQDYSMHHEIRDYAVLKYLKSIPQSVIKVSLPEPVNRMLFRQSLPALGLKTSIRAAFGTILVLIVFFNLDPSRLDHVRSLQGERYYVQNDEDLMRFHTYAGNQYLDSLDYSRATDEFEKAIAIREKLGRKDYLVPDYNLTWLTWKQGQDDVARDKFAEISGAAEEALADSQITIPPKSADKLLAVKSEANYNLGVMAIRTQDPDQASEEFQDVVESDENRTEAEYGQALAFMQKAIKTEGAAQATYFNLARTKIQQIQETDPAFFQKNARISTVLDSVSQHLTDTTVKDRFTEINTIIQGKPSVRPLPEVPIVLPKPQDSSKPAPIPKEFEIQDYFSEGLARIKYQGKFGFIDDKGLMRVSAIYDDARPFSEGLAAVRIGSKWGYINANNEQKITFRYAQAENFFQGRASVKQLGKWGVIDKKGIQDKNNIPIIPFEYDLPVRFEDTTQLAPGEKALAAVSKNGKYEYITLEGRPAFGDMKFQYAENFNKEGRAKVKRWDQRFMIDRNGKCVSTKCPEEKWYGKLTHTISEHEREVNISMYSPDGSFLLTAAADGKANIWDARGEVLIAQIQHDGRIFTAAISPNSRLIATGSEDQTIQVWRKNDNGIWVNLKSYEDIRQGVWSLAFHPNNKILACGTADKQLRIYSLDQDEVIDRLNGHLSGTVYGLTFSANGKYLISGGDDGSLRIWDWQQGIQTEQRETGRVLSLNLSPSGRLLAVGTKGKQVQIFTFAQGKLDYQFALGPFDDWVSHVVFSPGNDYLLTADYARNAMVWNLNTRKSVLRLPHTGTVRYADFSSDGKNIITATWGEQGNNHVYTYRLDQY